MSSHRPEQQAGDRPASSCTHDDVLATQPPGESQDHLTRIPDADVRVHITGLYGHTGAQRPALGALGKELITMIRVLRVLSA